MQLYKISDLATTNSQLAINLDNIERKKMKFTLLAVLSMIVTGQRYFKRSPYIRLV